MDKVKYLEGPKFIADKDDRLIYNCTLAGSDFFLTYIFNDNDKLIGARYVLDKIFSNPDFYVNDFAKFKEMLIKKYGFPYRDEQNWLSSILNKDPNNIGSALENSSVSLVAAWHNAETDIKLSLMKSDKIYLIIDYTAIKYRELENEEILKKSLDNL